MGQRGQRNKMGRGLDEQSEERLEDEAIKEKMDKKERRTGGC